MSSHETDHRETVLKDEIREHRDFLREIEGSDSFASQLVRMQTEDRIDFLGSELDALHEERLVLHFDEGVLQKHAMRTRLLGNLLVRFQTALTYTGWALRAGPGVEGSPPASILHGTDTEVLALAPGSFEIALRPRVLELPTEGHGEDILDSAIEVVLSLAQAAASNTFGDEVETQAEVLGRESARRLALWFKKVAESGLDTDFKWSVKPDRDVHLTKDQAESLGRWLEAVEEKFSEQRVTGTLRTADTIRRRFAIEDDTGIVFEGRVAPEVLDRGVIGERYAARLQVVTKESDHTGASSQSYVLLALDSVRDEARESD